MKIEEGLTLFLKAQAPSVKGRVDPVRLESTTLPAITTQLISFVRTKRQDGRTPLATARVQINCFAKYYATAKQTAHEVVDALHGYKGMMGTVVVTNTTIDNQQDDYRPDTDRHVQLIDALITHREEVA